MKEWRDSIGTVSRQWFSGSLRHHLLQVSVESACWDPAHSSSSMPGPPGSQHQPKGHRAGESWCPVRMAPRDLWLKEGWPFVSYSAEKSLDSSSNESPSWTPGSSPGIWGPSCYGDYLVFQFPAYPKYFEAELQIFSHFTFSGKSHERNKPTPPAKALAHLLASWTTGGRYVFVLKNSMHTRARTHAHTHPSILGMCANFLNACKEF